MEVILKEDVKKLGKRGEVVKVADGYGRNYLIPRGLAEEATTGNVKQLKNKLKAKKRKISVQIAEAKELAEKLEAEKYEISVKAGEKGRLFGSVTTKDIADLVEKAGYNIDKRKIDLDEHIKSLGVHKVKVKLVEDVEAILNIEVVEA
ncbi:MAG TPA: 50S ribosomal protein L9 [Halanaerobiales bacterium]|nr:50S ribosomal protein L9 [Halanaerobiales bacterium]